MVRLGGIATGAHGGVLFHDIAYLFDGDVIEFLTTEYDTRLTFGVPLQVGDVLATTNVALLFARFKTNDVERMGISTLTQGNPGYSFLAMTWEKICSMSLLTAIHDVLLVAAHHP